MKIVQINTDQESRYRVEGRLINVTTDKHWDKLSKIFKKHTYTIEYKQLEDKDSEYTINVFAKGSRRSFFTFKKPDLNVNQVEVYFKGDHDIKKEEPLIVRFIYKLEFVLEGGEDDCQSNKSSKCYYAWSKLKNQQKTTTIDGVERIKEKDLVTVLLEEIGPNIRRTNKLVIRLDEQPRDFEHLLQYPDSGHYSQGGSRKITVTKPSDKVVEGVEAYEHSIDTSVYVNDFYVSYLHNSRFFKIGDTSGYGYLDKVTAFFKCGSAGSKNLLLIMFRFKKAGGRHSTGNKLYVYKYSDFVKDLQSVTSSTATGDGTVETIDESDVITDQRSGLELRLKQEIERLKPLIKFSSEHSDKNENISETNQEDFGVGLEKKFKKVTLTPHPSGDKQDGSQGGPWTVYNNQLFTKYEPTAKIDDGVLTSITSSKYGSISVFYTSNNKALLVEFVKSGGKNKYIKRIDESGRQWDSEYDIEFSDPDYTSALVEELNEIGIAAKIIEDSSSGSRGEAHTSDQGGSTDNTAIYAGAGGGLGAAVIAGTGYAIYKYLRK